MNDPAPENITGSKTVSHNVNHTIRWDYVLLGVVVLYALYRVSGLIEATTGAGAGDEEETDVLEGAMEIPIEGVGNVQGLTV